MLRNSSPPIEPRRADAPTTATPAGAKNGASEAVTAEVVAAVDALEVPGGRLDRHRDLGDAVVRAARPRSPRSRRREHRAVVRQHLGEEAADADCPPPRELLEQPRADALALQLVGHREGDLGAGRVAQPHVAAERDDPLASVLDERSDQGSTGVPIRVEVALEADARPGRTVP